MSAPDVVRVVQGDSVCPAPPCVMSETALKNKRASSNPFEVLQSRTGGHGLGYIVPADKVGATIRNVARAVKSRGRGRRSPSGKRHDSHRFNIYINDKLDKNTKKVANSLSSSVALVANTLGEQVLETQKRAVSTLQSAQKRFLFDFGSNFSPLVGTSTDDVISRLGAIVPTNAFIEKAKFQDIKYIELISPEYFKYLLMYRIVRNRSRFHDLSGSEYVDEGDEELQSRQRHVVSEIRQTLSQLSRRMITACAVESLVAEPLRDTYFF
jgi:hypothetical protein